jgi:hypothetical protein
VYRSQVVCTFLGINNGDLSISATTGRLRIASLMLFVFGVGGAVQFVGG